MASIISTATAATLFLSSALPTTTTATTSSCLRFSRRIPLSFHPHRCNMRFPIGSGGSGKLTRFRCSAVKKIGESEFSSEVLASEVPVLVEFVADWCGPCRLISPIIEWASQEYKEKLKIVKIDHDANPQLIEEYKVYGLPCLILFKAGKEIPESRREGAITKVKLKEYLDPLLGSTTSVV